MGEILDEIRDCVWTKNDILGEIFVQLWLVTVMMVVCAVQEALPTWDKQIQSLCFQVNSIIEKIGATAPDWLSTASEHQMTS